MDRIRVPKRWSSPTNTLDLCSLICCYTYTVVGVFHKHCHILKNNWSNSHRLSPCHPCAQGVILLLIHSGGEIPPHIIHCPFGLPSWCLQLLHLSAPSNESPKEASVEAAPASCCSLLRHGGSTPQEHSSFRWVTCALIYSLNIWFEKIIATEFLPPFLTFFYRCSEDYARQSLCVSDMTASSLKPHCFSGHFRYTYKTDWKSNVSWLRKDYGTSSTNKLRNLAFIFFKLISNIF